MDSTCHVTECHLIHETRVQNAVDDVASTIHECPPAAAAAGSVARAPTVTGAATAAAAAEVDAASAAATAVATAEAEAVGSYQGLLQPVSTIVQLHLEPFVPDTT